MIDLSRMELLYSREEMDKICRSKVLLVGVGGVGGYIAELLVRSGISDLTLVDFDTIAPSNLNRQIVALEENVGKVKVFEMKKRLEAISSSINVKAINERLTKTNLESIVSKDYDIVIDAIDSVADKTELIVFAKEQGTKIISAMGAGNRRGVPNFEIVDIFKTHDDSLAKVMRKNLKARGVKRHTVVCSREPQHSSSRPVGSVAHEVCAMACVVVSFVLNYIAGGESL